MIALMFLLKELLTVGSLITGPPAIIWKNHQISRMVSKNYYSNGFSKVEDVALIHGLTNCIKNQDMKTTV